MKLSYTETLWVEQKTNISIYIEDLTGRRIKTITKFTSTEKGDYNIPVNFSDMQQGIYFIVVKSIRNTQTKKIIHI